MKPEKPDMEKIRRFCDYQERCQQDLREKLYQWGFSSAERENIIADLITEAYVNEERFARAFARGKFRIKQWGKLRITRELKQRHLSDYCIKAALSEINETEYRESLGTLLQKRWESLDEPHPILKTRKTFAYALSKGFESELIKDLLQAVTQIDDLEIPEED